MQFPSRLFQSTLMFFITRILNWCHKAILRLSHLFPVKVFFFKAYFKTTFSFFFDLTIQNISYLNQIHVNTCNQILLHIKIKSDNHETFEKIMESYSKISNENYLIVMFKKNSSRFLNSLAKKKNSRK